MESNKFIELVLKYEKDREELATLIEDYKNLSAEELCEKYEDELDLEWFFDDLEDDENIMPNIIAMYLEEKERFFHLDWSGEEEENEVIEFINEQLEDYFEEKFQIDIEEIEKKIFSVEDLKANESYIFEQLREMEKGDYIIKKLSIIDDFLKEFGYNLLSFDTGGDEYCIGIFEKKTAEYLCEQKTLDEKFEISFEMCSEWGTD